jgi:transcriptional regulator with XRE-family HTH domain
MGVVTIDPVARGVLLAFFGGELRRRRMATGLSLERLGQEIHSSASLIAKIENGDRVPQVPTARALDKFFSTGEWFTRLAEEMAEPARTYPLGFPDFVGKEREAISISEFEVRMIPGLLQTEDYARVLFRAGRPHDSDEEIEELVKVRMDRQRILDRTKPPRLWVIIGEAVLRQAVGGPKVMAVQLGHIARLAERPNVVVQVVPFSIGAHAGLLGTFTLLTLPGGIDVAFTESIKSAQLVEYPEDVAEFTAAFDMLRIEALPREESLDFIRKVQGEYESESGSS